MDETKFGTRNARGHWTPHEPLKVGALLDMPWSFSRFLKWLPSYFLPWNLAFAALAVLIWTFATPAKSSLVQIELWWVALIFFRNAALISLVFGVLELRLYLRRAQGTRFKYNAHFPADRPARVFWFRSQARDNILRTFASGVPIWTGYEVILLWCWANDFGPWTGFDAHPVWLAVFALVLPIIHEVHFYAIHRLIHTSWLYKHVHSVHHNSVNPSPWSSLAMHPVEHLLYWSGTLVHLVIASHPILVLYHLQITATGSVVGHIGFDKIETGEDRAIDTHAFAHYLHHKYFEVNYADGMLPLDKWMGTWHDGTDAAHQRMRARLKRS